MPSMMPARNAAASEWEHWAAIAETRGRSYVVRYISVSTEARQKRLNGYYTALLQRSVDSSGLRSWLPLLITDGDITAQAFIASSAEYWKKAGTRFP